MLVGPPLATWGLILSWYIEVPLLKAGNLWHVGGHLGLEVGATFNQLFLTLLARWEHLQDSLGEVQEMRCAWRVATNEQNEQK